VRIGLAVPCYNEAERLDRVAIEQFAMSSSCADLLFVDDGSTDDTWACIEGLVAAAPECLSGLRLPRNGGKAEAVRAGMLALLERQYDVVGFWDADLATPLEALPRFISVLDDHPHIEWVIGSRVRLLGRRVERRTLRHYLGRGFATLASAALGIPVYDTQCGAKLFRVSPGLRRILSVPFTSRWIFDVEMIRRLSLLDGPDRRTPTGIIYELPLDEWRDVQGSKVRSRDFIRAALELFRIRFGRQMT
jgi:dolichyl-phosphate beta-glucosyltransferase